MKILIINGVNLNMLGIREPSIYGTGTLQNLENSIKEYCQDLHIEVECYQSNHEGAIVETIQKAYHDKVDGIVINAGAYTHTSVAILDALKSVAIPTVEVHISDIHHREDFRKFSYISLVAVKMICGEGVKGYLHAIDYLNSTMPR